MQETIHEILISKLNEKAPIDILSTLRKGFLNFTRNWSSFLGFSLVSGFITLLAFIFGGIFLELISKVTQGPVGDVILLIFGTAIVLFFLWLKGTIHAGYYIYLSEDEKEIEPIPFSYFWLGFHRSKVFLGIALIQLLGIAIITMIFGFPHNIFLNGSNIVDQFPDLLYDMSIMGTFDYLIGIATLIPEYWMIAIPVLIFFLGSTISFPLAVIFELKAYEAISFSFRFIIKNSIPSAIVWISIPLCFFFANRIFIGGLHFLGIPLESMEEPLYPIFMSLSIPTIYTALRPSVLYSLTGELTKVDHSSPLDTLIDEIGSE